MGNNKRNKNIFPLETVSRPCGLKHHPASPISHPTHTFHSLQWFPVCEQAKHDSFYAPVLPHACLPAMSISEFIFWKYDSHKSLYSKLETYFPHCIAPGCIWNERNCFITQGFTRQLPGLFGCSHGGNHLFPDCSASLFIFQMLLLSSLLLLPGDFWEDYSRKQKLVYEVGTSFALTHTFLTLLHFCFISVF